MRNAILALLIVLVALTSIGQAQTTIPNCGAFGVDLSSISFDISKNVSTPTDPGYIYVVHPCGAVTDAGCVADSTSDGSMVCQRGLSDAYSLSKWNASTVIYSRDRFGLYQQLITGELCGANPRQSIIYYQCSQADTTPRMISVVESPQCVYNIVIYTSLTCALPVEAPCVFAGVDFNDMFAQGDLNFTSVATNFNWYVHMCASSTSNARCRNDSTSNTSMICQQRIDLSDSFGIAIYNESTIQWQIVPTGNNAGMMFTVPNGEYCAAAGRNRIATIQMICDPTLGLESSYIYGVAEVQTCVYQITIRTALSCSVLELTSSTGPGISLSSSWWPAQQTCSFNGYNLQSMSNGPDLHWGGFVSLVYYDFYFHMCGWVRNSQCASDSSTYNSMFCQASITNPEDNYGLDYFVPGQWVGWTTTQYGISYSSYLGELCGTSRRLTTVNFICDPQGTTRIDTVLIDPVSQCNVNMTIKTPLVCNPDGSNAPPVIPECIFNGWDFRYLTPNNDDLQLYVNGSTPYYITLHMCGEVEYRPCKLDSSASTSMICQTQAWSGGESYSLSTYVPASETWTEFPAQQMIQMHVATGELCGSTPRVANVNFICDLAFQNSTGLATQLISYNETSTCVYQLVVIANPIICPYFNGSGWNTTSSSTGTSQTTAGNTGVGTGCSNGANLPVGAIAVSIVLDSPFTSLVNSINYINTQLLNTLSNILSVPITQLQCGELSGGLLPAVAAPTTAQSLFTFYILPPATSTGQSPISVSNTLMNIINTDPTVINMVLPIGVPLIVQGQYASLSCQAGQYPGADGSCHSPDSGSSGLSGGAIAGIVVGSIVGAILLIGIVIFLLSRGSKSNKGFSSNEGGRGVEMADSSEHEHETENESY